MFDGSEASERPIVRIEPWTQGDLALLQKTLSDPEMTKHIGGPEGPESIAQRQTGYEQENSRQFKIVEEGTGAATGWVGYWELTWRDEQIFEIGWSVLPGFQGRGIGSMATAQAIELARNERTLRFLHAFPSVDNATFEGLPVLSQTSTRPGAWHRLSGYVGRQECSSET